MSIGFARQAFAGQEDDSLEGGAGNDILFGGRGNDTFVFNLSDMDLGQDTILDFTNGVDQIEVMGSMTAITFADILGLLHQDGSDVLISFDDTRSVRLVNTLVTDLDDSDFVLQSTQGAQKDSYASMLSYQLYDLEYWIDEFEGSVYEF